MISRGFVGRSLHDVRQAFDPGGARPAYAAGVRAAVATVAPLIADSFLHTGGGAWMSLAGLNGALIDRGGPYRTRAAVMGMLAVTSAVAVLVGSAAAGHPAIALLATFVLAVLCGLARAWTDVGPGFGVTILVTYVVALAVPVPSLPAALIRAGFILIGGAWAMLIALMLWPIRPYRPVRLRVSACFQAVSDYAREAAAAIAENPAHDPMRFHQHRLDIRASLEAARSALATSRRGRTGETARGERLLVLQEIADQLFAHLIVLLEENHVRAAQSTDTVLARALPDLLLRISETTRAIALAIQSEDDLPAVPVDWSSGSIESAPDLRDIIDRMADYASNASAVVASINSGTERVPHALGDVLPPESRLFALEPLLRPDPIVLRHALRVAVVTTIAVGIGQVLHLNHGYWVSLTVIVILQPYGAATRQKALQRVIGTVLGGIVAALLSAWFHSELAVLLLIAGFTMLCVALLPLNYGAYAIFGTPAFVLLAEAGAGDWHLAGLRILNTCIGGALALFGMRVLWPTPERSQLPKLVGQALATEAEYLALAMQALERSGIAPAVAPTALSDERRRLAHDALAAEESLQRLLVEHRGPSSSLEPMMAAITYIRRTASTIGSLALLPSGGDASSLGPARAVTDVCRAALHDLAAAVGEGRAPAPLPSLRAAVNDAAIAPLVRDRLVRLARQVRVLHDAVDRWVATRLPT